MAFSAFTDAEVTEDEQSILPLQRLSQVADDEVVMGGDGVAPMVGHYLVAQVKVSGEVVLHDYLPGTVIDVPDGIGITVTLPSLMAWYTL